MLDQLDTADSDYDVACRWLQSNEEIWTDWLPERGKCFSQFGIYDAPRPPNLWRWVFPFSLALMHAYMVCLCLHASVPSSCTHECTYAEWGNIQYTTIHTCTRHLYIYILTCWLGCFLLHSPTLTEGIAEKFLQTREGSTTCRACPSGEGHPIAPKFG